MKKITKIEYQKNNKDRVNIYLDDNFAFGIDLNIMIKYSLSKNMELEDEFIDEILKAEEEVSVYNYGLSVLSRRSKSVSQLESKMLEKGYDQLFIDKAISKLKEQKYLDDERYCEMIIKNKINTSKYGKRKIKMILYEKGINREIIDEKLKLLSDEDEFERAYYLGSRKINTLNEKDTRKKSIKLSNYLINKGFDFNTVNKIVSKLIVDSFDNFEGY